jgi:DNA-binding FadR family transcriptional regulator
MRRSLEDMARFGLAVEEGQAADRQFHRQILEATDNETLVSLAGSVGAAVQWTTHFKQRGRTAPRDPVPEHRALFDAIAAADADAARQGMTVLVRLAFEDMQPALD